MPAEIQFEIANDPSTLPPSKSLRIGDVAVSIASPWSELAALTAGLEPFASASCLPDIEIQVDWADRLFPPSTARIFDSGAVWSLFRDAGDFIFDCEVPALGLRPYKRMRVSSDFTKVHVLLNHDLLGDYARVFALDYPSDELLITNYLAYHGLGVEVHGCGLIDSEGRGHLFLGHSGAGKSTTARLWESFHRPTILSDDRIILRLHDGALWMYGTPWHGEAAFAHPGKAKLTEIFILQHGMKNNFVPMSKARAAGELFARSFPPFHSAVGLERTVEFLNRVVDTVPCFDFQFVPDRSALESILRFRGAP